MKAPLRKILGHTHQGVLLREVLECGHLHRIRQDHYGETHPQRRRCQKCLDQKDPELTPQELQVYSEKGNHA